MNDIRPNWWLVNIIQVMALLPGAVRQQAINGTNVDQGPWWHEMASLGHNELID